jgi:hypothetical protein
MVDLAGTILFTDTTIIMEVKGYTRKLPYNEVTGRRGSINNNDNSKQKF